LAICIVKAGGSDFAGGMVDGFTSGWPEAGFSPDGSIYVIRDPRLIRDADSDLWNDEHLLRISHRGTVKASFLDPDSRSYSGKLRPVYIKDEDTGEVWSAPWEPMLLDPEAFCFEIHRTHHLWRVIRNGIEVVWKVVVADKGVTEVWDLQVRNLGKKARRLTVVPVFPVGSPGLLRDVVEVMPEWNGFLHDLFPYYVDIPAYEPLSKLRNLIYLVGSESADFQIASEGAFIGNGSWHRPDMLCEGSTYTSSPAGTPLPGSSVFASGYRLKLKGGGEQSFSFAFGVAGDKREIAGVRRKLSRGDYFERLVKHHQKDYDQHPGSLKVKTGDRNFDAFVNYWLPWRMLQIVRSLRFNLSPQGRNVIQDAMGGSLVDPNKARHWFTRVWAHQHRNGWLPHGMPFAPGVSIMPITRIPHKDTNVWGPDAVRFYLSETGDWSILDEPVPFADGPGKASLYDHLCRGLEWLLNDRTRRKLCRLGQGDWNDPLNMAGMNEKGESAWLTEALAYSLEQWAEVCEGYGDDARAQGYRKEAVACRRAVRKYFMKGPLVARGTKDDESLFGDVTQSRARIFLNAQSWALMAGIPDEKEAEGLIAAVEEHLMTPAGPMTLSPPFEAMDTSIGKLTQKCPGTGENASVYCHAVVFYAYALFRYGFTEKAFDALRTLLPGTDGHTVKQASQIPLYIPNFYRGSASGLEAGLSSHSPTTGTVSWYYRTVVEMLFGLKAEEDCLVIEPQLPVQWGEVDFERQWRGYSLKGKMIRSDETEVMEVWLNGSLLEGNVIGLEMLGKKNHLEIRLPVEAF